MRLAPERIGQFEETNTNPRGEETLFESADITQELRRFSPSRKDGRRRRIIGRSKRVETPERLTYRWNPNSGRFRVIDDTSEERGRTFWPQAFDLLRDSPDALSVEMILDWWSNRFDRPSRKQIDEWLRRAMFLNQISQEGKGVKADPFRYRLCKGWRGIGGRRSWEGCREVGIGPGGAAACSRG